jgi:hypothetical protein
MITGNRKEIKNNFLKFELEMDKTKLKLHLTRND